MQDKVTLIIGAGCTGKTAFARSIAKAQEKEWMKVVIVGPAPEYPPPIPVSMPLRDDLILLEHSLPFLASTNPSFPVPRTLDIITRLQRYMGLPSQMRGDKVNKKHKKGHRHRRPK